MASGSGLMGGVTAIGEGGGSYSQVYVGMWVVAISKRQLRGCVGPAGGSPAAIHRSQALCGLLCVVVQGFVVSRFTLWVALRGLASCEPSAPPRNPVR